VKSKFQSVRGVITRGKQILLMHRKKDGEEYWVFPGGKVEEGETPEETLTREIWEELSLKVTKTEKMYPYTNKKGMSECFFVCEVENGEPKIHPSGTEKNTEIDWYNPEWIELSKAKMLEKLYPEPLAQKFLELYEN